VHGGFSADRDVAPVDLEDARIAAGGRAAGSDPGSGEKAQLHEAARAIGREVEGLEHTLFTLPEGGQRAGWMVENGYQLV